MANGRIEPGQPIGAAISARAWNRAQDAADIVLGASAEYNGAAAAMQAGAANVVMIMNQSGAPVPACGILGISGVANAPASAENKLPEMCRRPVLSGVLPTYTHAMRFALTLEPIAAGSIGRAAVSGAVAFRIESLASSHDFAVVKSGSSLVVQTASAGPFRILSRTTTGKDGWVWAVGTIDASADNAMRLCKTTSAFAKGTTTNLNVWHGGTPPNETQTSGTQVESVVNKYGNIAAGKFVSVALHGNGRWYVVAAECG